MKCKWQEALNSFGFDNEWMARLARAPALCAASISPRWVIARDPPQCRPITPRNLWGPRRGTTKCFYAQNQNQKVIYLMFLDVNHVWRLKFLKLRASWWWLTGGPRGQRGFISEYCLVIYKTATFSSSTDSVFALKGPEEDEKYTF